MKAITLYCRMTTRLSYWLAVACAGLVVIIVPSMLYEVVARYFFDSPTSWAIPLSSLLLGPYFMLAGPYLLHINGHVNVDILHGKLPRKWAAAMDCLIYLVIILFFCLLFGAIWEFAYRSFAMRETLFSTWSAPIWPFKLVIPITFVLMIAQAAVELARAVFRALDRPDPAAAGQREAA